MTSKCAILPPPQAQGEPHDRQQTQSRRPRRRPLGQHGPHPRLAPRPPRGGRRPLRRRHSPSPGKWPTASASPKPPTRWQTLVSREDIDVIDIVTPSNTHHELASAAIDAGKHVLCEKPVAQDFRETLRLSALAESKGLKTKLGLHLPLHPRRPVRQVAHRRRVRWQALHLQRLRAELPVDQPPDSPAPLPDARRPVRNPGRLPRRLRRSHHRHRPLVGRRRLFQRRRHHA